jgi:hypothetical protein
MDSELEGALYFHAVVYVYCIWITHIFQDVWILSPFIIFKSKFEAGHWWFTIVILAMSEAEMGGLEFKDWKYGSNSTTPALQAWSLEFKSQSHWNK